MIRTKKIVLGEFEFECRVSGETQNEVVILLHGFPETSIMWVQLMDDLAAKGFYCVAPNQRGYSEGACPKGAKNYTVQKLGEDIFHLADALKAEKFHLVGHDWGASIGWQFVNDYPDRVISWTALSIPHNLAFRKALATDPEQKKKIRYMAFFVLPFLPEMFLRSGDFKRLRKLWKNCSAEELADYLSVFRRKQTLTATLNYYRANIGKGNRSQIGDINTPTLFIWGKTDLAVTETAAKNNHDYMKGDYTFIEIDGGHWLMQENYEEVAPAIIVHLDKFRTS